MASCGDIEIASRPPLTPMISAILNMTIFDELEAYYAAIRPSSAKRETAISKNFSSFSMPMNPRPSLRAANPVVPLPIVGSNTVSHGLE